MRPKTCITSFCLAFAYKNKRKAELKLVTLPLVLAACGGGGSSENSVDASIDDSQDLESPTLSAEAVKVKEGANDSNEKILEITFSEDVVINDESGIRLIKTRDEYGSSGVSPEEVRVKKIEVVENKIFLTFLPLENSSYRVVFAAGSLADKSGNTFPTVGGSNETEEFVASPDNKAPSVPALALSMGKVTHVKESRPTFVVTLENPEPGGKVFLYHANKIVGETIIVGSDVEIEVKVDEGKLEDGEDVEIRAGITDAEGRHSNLSDEVVFVLDTKSPTLENTIPSARDKMVTFYFSETIAEQPHSIYKLADGTMLPKEDYSVEVEGAQLTLTFLGGAVPGNGRYFLAPVQDLAGNETIDNIPFSIDWIPDFVGVQSLRAEKVNDLPEVADLRLYFTVNISFEGTDKIKLMRKFPGSWSKEVHPDNYNIEVENDKQLAIYFEETLVEETSEAIFYVELDEKSIKSSSGFWNTHKLESSEALIDRKVPQIVEGRKVDAKTFQIKFSEPIRYKDGGAIYLWKGPNGKSEKVEVEARLLNEDTIELLPKELSSNFFINENFLKISFGDGVLGDRADQQNFLPGGEEGEEWVTLFIADDLENFEKYRESDKLLNNLLEWDSSAHTLMLDFLGGIFKKSDGERGKESEEGCVNKESEGECAYNFEPRWVQRADGISNEELADKIDVMRKGEDINRVSSASVYEGDLVIKLRKFEEWETSENGESLALKVGDILQVKVSDDALTDVWGKTISINFLSQAEEVTIDQIKEAETVSSFDDTDETLTDFLHGSTFLDSVDF